jgi:glutamyl-tRNA synthetase
VTPKPGLDLEALVGAGRFAPSPSGALHIGNLRTALLAWLFARASGRAFRVRIDDLDRVASGAARQQLDHLAALGLDHDGDVMFQSERIPVYSAAIDHLIQNGLTYECFCTRREIRDAASAPHGPLAEGRYPGTCRLLSSADRAAKLAAGRTPALRLRAQTSELGISDRLHGHYAGAVDDVVLRRNDGLPAYNLAVVIDDDAQGVDQVVRGNDLLFTTPSQAHLADLLGLPIPVYAHVPLALNRAGQRLAKRDGAVTLPDLVSQGWTVENILALLADSLGLPRRRPADLVEVFDPAALPTEPWIVDPPALLRPGMN